MRAVLPAGPPPSVVARAEADKKKAVDAESAQTPGEQPAAWGPRPLFASQLQEAGLWRLKSQVTARFDLLDDTQLEDWNKLQARLFPETAPEILLIRDPETFTIESRLILVVTYNEIEYRQDVKPTP